MKLRFLGTNGWYSTDTGNTTCIMIETKKLFTVLDAGDGINKLDKYLTSEMPIYLFLSHFHLDHIYGFNTFNKFDFQNPLTIYGQPRTKEIVKKIINRPYSVPFEELKIKVDVKELEEGKHDRPETPFPVECRYLVHADPCFGYRLELDEKIISYCTDTGMCDNVIGLSEDADILIAECGYKTAEQAALYGDWPHLNPKDTATIAKKANVKKLFLMHFDAYLYPTIDDRIEAENIAKEIFPDTTASLDDMEIDI